MSRAVALSPQANLPGQMRLALLSEFGAWAINTDLGRRVREPELRILLGGLAQASRAQARMLACALQALVVVRRGQTQAMEPGFQVA